MCSPVQRVAVVFMFSFNCFPQRVDFAVEALNLGFCRLTFFFRFLAELKQLFGYEQVAKRIANIRLTSSRQLATLLFVDWLPTG